MISYSVSKIISGNGGRFHSRSAWVLTYLTVGEQQTSLLLIENCKFENELFYLNSANKNL